MDIADIKIGKSVYYPLEQDSIDILKELGCEYKGKLKMLMTRMVGLDPSKSGIKNAVEYDGKVYNLNQYLFFTTLNTYSKMKETYLINFSSYQNNPYFPWGTATSDRELFTQQIQNNLNNKKNDEE